MEGHCILCEYCPIEKEVDGACFDELGTWEQDDTLAWVFNGTWKCIYFNKESGHCECPEEK